jgi:hypothetical protein
MDVKSAFLNGVIQEEVFVRQPLGFENLKYPNKMYKLLKACTGLRKCRRLDMLGLIHSCYSMSMLWGV